MNEIFCIAEFFASLLVKPSKYQKVMIGKGKIILGCLYIVVKLFFVHIVYVSKITLKSISIPTPDIVSSTLYLRHNNVDIKFNGDMYSSLPPKTYKCFCIFYL